VCVCVVGVYIKCERSKRWLYPVLMTRGVSHSTCKKNYTFDGKTHHMHHRIHTHTPPFSSRFSILTLTHQTCQQMRYKYCITCVYRD
jgi:hypothetical protein